VPTFKPSKELKELVMQGGSAATSGGSSRPSVY
jgi:hypothetical protein